MENQKKIPMTKEAIRAFSLSINDLACSRGLYNYLRKHGVAFLGEACRLKRDPRFTCGIRAGSADWKELSHILETHGLRFGLDPLAYGWQPPYWGDPEWVAALSTPLSEAGDFPSWLLLREKGKGNDCVGQFIRSITGEYLTNWARHQCLFGLSRFDLFRPGMIVPPDWKPMSATERAAVTEAALKTLPADVIRAQVTTGLALSAKISGDVLPRAVDDVMRAIAAAGSARALLNILVVPAANERFVEHGQIPTATLPLSEIDLSLLALSVRTDNALRTWGKIYSVSHLARLSKNDLLKIRGLGLKGVREIQETLTRIGIRK